MQTLVEIGSLSCAKSDTTHILFPDKIGKNSHIFKTQPHLVINDIINIAILILFFFVSLFTNELMKSKSSTERKKWGFREKKTHNGEKNWKCVGEN